MQKRLEITVWLGIVTAGFILLSAFNGERQGTQVHLKLSTTTEKLDKAAFEILDTKCNVCHRKQNPFMVFKEKNMTKRAKKIYQMVFVERRMPKGNDIRLTNEEYSKLEKWLFTQQIF